MDAIMAGFKPARTKVASAASWTHRLDTQKMREHDFVNLLLDFRYAEANVSGENNKERNGGHTLSSFPES